MRDAEHYKDRADTMRNLLARLAANWGAAGGGNGHTQQQLMNQASKMVSDYDAENTVILVEELTLQQSKRAIQV